MNTWLGSFRWFGASRLKKILAYRSLEGPVKYTVPLSLSRHSLFFLSGLLASDFGLRYPSYHVFQLVPFPVSRCRSGLTQPRYYSTIYCSFSDGANKFIGDLRKLNLILAHAHS